MRTALVLLGLAAVAAADTVWLKNGRKLVGLVVAEEPEVVVNPYRSAVPGMTFGVERAPADQVKRIERTLPEAAHLFQQRVREASTAEGLVELAAWCEEQRLKEEERWACELALRLDPGNAEARRRLGSRAPKGDHDAQVALARRFLEAPDAAAADAALAEIRKDRSFPLDELALRRAWRSARQPKGLQAERALAMRADRLPAAARYTLFVPEEYDPLEPTPLVIGLHGGGAGGADGKLVVGSGEQAMPFYLGPCTQRRWICACPTALQAGWGARPNDDLVDALLEELGALYNIDENRIYLVGHSMGGGGTWAQGARLPETWAAIAPASSFGVHGIDKLEKTKTPFYVYHSDDDPRTPIGAVRPAMERLPDSDADFVYTELPGRGHSFPREVIEDIFVFFAMRVRAEGPGRFKPQVRPLSSFERKLSRDERKYLPPLEPPAGGDGDEPESLRALLQRLRTGGGVAEAAAAELAAHPDPAVSAAVAKVLLRGDVDSDVRRYAAQVLGERKAADQIDALGRVLLIEEESRALLAALEAIERIDPAAAGDALVRFLRKRADYLGGRVQGGWVDHSDWTTVLPTLARACTLIGSAAPRGGAVAIADAVVDGLLLDADLGVLYDVQNQNPLPALHALAEAACSALGRLGGDDARAALQRLADASGPATGADVQRLRGPVARLSGFPRDPRVAAVARDALAGLAG